MSDLMKDNNGIKAIYIRCVTSLISNLSKVETAPLNNPAVLPPGLLRAAPSSQFILSNDGNSFSQSAIEDQSRLTDDQMQDSRKNKIEFISHELKAPLACIIMLIYSLMTLELSEQAKSYVTMIESQINLSLNLINDLQDANLISVGKLQPKICIFDPIKVFMFVRNMFQMEADINKIKLYFSFSRQADKHQHIKKIKPLPLQNSKNHLSTDVLPQYLSGDQMRFTQVLINLIKNSMKFCTKRGDSIHVISAFDHSTMTVAVIDTGKGIQPHEKKKLFHLFGKLKSTADVN